LRRNESVEGRGSRRFDPQSATGVPVGLSLMSVQAVLKARSTPLGPRLRAVLFFGYNDVQEGFEEPSQLGGHDKRGRPTSSISTATYCPHQPHQR
jgi:hypothetical protein